MFFTSQTALLYASIAMGSLCCTSHLVLPSMSSHTMSIHGSTTDRCSKSIHQQYVYPSGRLYRARTFPRERSHGNSCVHAAPNATMLHTVDTSRPTASLKQRTNVKPIKSVFAKWSWLRICQLFMWPPVSLHESSCVRISLHGIGNWPPQGNTDNRCYRCCSPVSG